MNLWLFNPQLERINNIETFSSFIITKNYNKPSSFELHLPMTDFIRELLQTKQLVLGMILVKDQEREGYVIEEISPNFEQFGGSLTIKGRDLRSYLERRVILGEKKNKGTMKQLLTNWLNESILNPINPKRKMKQMRLGQLPEFATVLNLETDYPNLLEAMTNLLAIFDLGFMIQLDFSQKIMTINIYQGINRTSSQTTQNQAIFSSSFENILTQAVVFNQMDYKTTALLAYEREEKAYLLEVTDGTEDLLRREIYVDAKSIGKSSEEEPITIEEQQALVKQKGNETLLEYPLIETFEAEVVTNGSLRYLEDFDLGDKVTVIAQELSLQLETRIVTVEEVYEKNGLEIRLTFGTNIPTLVDKIKRKVK
ncbi:siphovirus ReqiPepy6 Gp37-like family protein [Carnobacterium gallinarum]|uniref:siphovirus ReqiPepy6 Gp37-like family protein n=1 Tax=Carnobacterium gallinarum TaxID=2749 RepID=UPI0005565B13|nr:siphovirus ReqiPepy6 Gp37-like family protein [Carnobacterium gallinarum]